MLRESARSFNKIYIACGRTDLRKGIEGLSALVQYQFKLNPFEKDILYLFCGKKTDRIKGLVWEGTGFLLLYKKLNCGAFAWPRTTNEARQITPELFEMLMDGYDIIARKPVTEVHPWSLV